MKDFEDFSLYFQRAKQLKAQSDISKAILNILEAIKIAEATSHVHSIGDPVIFYSTVLLTHTVLAEMYFTAGELFAVANDMESSLKYYKLYQYHNSFINQKLNNKIRFFSFRKFNEYSISDLINNEVTVSRSTAMNDPVDSIINLWAQDENLKELCKDKKHIAPLVKSFDYYRIRSFCKGKGNSPVRNVLMWSHYADEHRGYCIKYRFSEHFIKQEENTEHKNMYITQIHYANKNERIDIRERRISTQLAYATKSKPWKYEDEVRLIVYDPNNTQDFLGIELDDDSSIEAIFFGCRCPKSTIKTIQNIIKNRPAKFENKLVKFYKMKVNPLDVYHFTYEEM